MSQVPDNQTLSLRDRIALSADMIGVPRDVAFRLFFAESGMRIDAPAGDNGRSFGIGQVQEDTGRRYGLDVHDPRQNIIAALRYLKDGYQRYGTWGMAYAAYRSGLNGPRNAGNQRPPGVEQESMDFVAGVPGTQWNGLVVGQGNVPPAGAQIGLEGPAGIQLPGGFNTDDFGPNGQLNPNNIGTNIGKSLSDALSESGIRTSNQLANFWNSQSPTILFWAVAAGALIFAFIMMRGGTVVKIVKMGSDNLGATTGASQQQPKPKTPSGDQLNRAAYKGYIAGINKAQRTATNASDSIKPITAATNIRAG